MALSIAFDGSALPPTNRTYTLKLTYVPAGMENPPPVGTTWTVGPVETLTVEVPTFKTYNGLEGYQFEFTVSETPEPATLVSLLLLGLCLRRR
jgi:hypothetical protein